MHTSFTNHKQTLISYLLQYYFSAYYIWFVHFWVVIFGGVNGVGNIMGGGLLTWDFSFCLGDEKEK